MLQSERKTAKGNNVIEVYIVDFANGTFRWTKKEMYLARYANTNLDVYLDKSDAQKRVDDLNEKFEI